MFAADTRLPMLIINADDWGGWRSATDAALDCANDRLINSVSAMVFMDDSVRGSQLAPSTVRVGLHLNLDRMFTGKAPSDLCKRQETVAHFLSKHKYRQLIYNPALRDAFAWTVQAQVNEFVRLYHRAPAHFDSHHHMHLCANMLIDPVIAAGARVRPSFSFSSREKSFPNRLYRRLIDRRLARRYLLSDYFFSLSHCLASQQMQRVFQLAGTKTVELMTHPEDSLEYAYLTSGDYKQRLVPILRHDSETISLRTPEQSLFS